MGALRGGVWAALAGASQPERRAHGDATQHSMKRVEVGIQFTQKCDAFSRQALFKPLRARGIAEHA